MNEENVSDVTETAEITQSIETKVDTVDGLDNGTVIQGFIDDDSKKISEDNMELGIANEDIPIPGEEELNEPVELGKQEPLELLEKSELEDDGFLGIPKFTDQDCILLDHNILLDTSMIGQHSTIMRDLAENMLDLENEIPGEEKEKSFDNIFQMYVASRNILVTYKNSITEYKQFISENKDEILNQYEIDSSKYIQMYISDCEKMFDLNYEEGSFLFFILAVALKRMNYDVGNTVAMRFLKLKQVNDYDEEFEKILMESMNSIDFMISNISNDTSYSGMGSSEKDVIKITSDTIKRLNKMVDEKNTDERFKYIGSSRSLFMLFLFRLSKVLGKKTFFRFKTARSKYESLKKRIKRRAAANSNPTVPPPTPFTDEFIRSRLLLLITESSIKKWFSFALFGDSKILTNKELFLTKLHVIDEVITPAKMISSIVNVFAYKMIFDELARIISYVDDKVYTCNAKKMSMLKGYITFVSYYKKSSKYVNYGSKELYNKYIDGLLTEVVNHLNKSK